MAKWIVYISIALIIGGLIVCKLWPKLCPVTWAALVASPIPPFP